MPPAARFHPMKSRILWFGLIFSFLLTPLARAKNFPALPSNTPLEPAQPKWSWLQALLPKSFQSNPKLDMTVYTEMTDLGRKLPPVSPEHPATYQLDYAGFHPMGELSAGHQLPTQEEMEQLLTRVLASQGYQPAAVPTQPPDLLLVYVWGTHNRITQLDEDSPAGAEAVRRNIIERALLVGGKKFADELNKVIDDSQRAADSAASTSRLPGFTPIMTSDLNTPINLFEQKNPNNQFLLEQSLDDCYFVVASAYDYRSVSAGKKELLWRTRMTVNAQGVSMKQALPTVVISAGPFFGRETVESAVIQRRAVPDGTIEISTPTVVEGPAPGAATTKKQ
jgi:hypothetical protein